MNRNVRTNRRQRRKSRSKSKPRKRQNLQKPNGAIGRRVQKVGGERFAIVCVDPAKHRSDWMMADYFGNLLIEPQKVEHQAAGFRTAVQMIRQAQEQHDIQDIIDGIRHESQVDLALKTISNLNANRLPYNHPLVKCSADVLKSLGLEPVSEPTESALSIFLSHKIPAVTIGLTNGYNYYEEDATMEIEPMFKGIAQIIGIITAIDNGVCDA